VYTDGSVGITTGAVEMGQGVNTKILQVAATVLSIQPHRIKIHTTNTFKIANTSPSAASATADLNGKATFMACTAIVGRLKKMIAEDMKVDVQAVALRDEYVWVNGQKTDLDWRSLVMAGHIKRIGLSEHAHYATPEIHFDATKEKGHPFAYHVYGTALVGVTVDCIRGTYTVDTVKVVHDFGASMNTAVDIGQIEGGIVQGIGWMTMEEVVYDANGRLRSNALSTYKVPDIYAAPKEIAIDFLQTPNDNLAIFRSKAVGEPPLMYGIGAYFALRQAVRAFNKSGEFPFAAPMTPEKVLMALYATQKEGIIQTHEETIDHLAVDK
jgi:xanthine dehydrogenase large subunit